LFYALKNASRRPGTCVRRCCVRSDLLPAENAAPTRLYDEGAMGAATRRQLHHALDLEATRLSDGQR
jgi:hypothetical protein